MIYKFKSKASGDVIMTSPIADPILRAVGKEPASQGIFEVADMPAAIAALEQAIDRDEAARKQAEEEAHAEGRKLPAGEAITMRQRAWPLVDMLKRSHDAGHDVVWGV